MTNSTVAVLDFGSGKITVLAGNKAFDSSLRIKAKGSADYAGFMDGEFLEPGNLKVSVKEAVASAEKLLGKKIKRLYVGVPTEFSYSETAELDLLFNSKTKIKKQHVSKLFNLHKAKFISNTHTVISKTPIYYKLDNGIKIVNPMGKISTNLKMFASFIYIENNFLSMVEQALLYCGVTNFEFVSGAHAESVYLSTSQLRENGVILIDCGYITTSVAHVVGDGIVDLKSVSIGGGHIAADIAEVLNIPFATAEQLKRKVVVTLNATADDVYEAVMDGKMAKFKAKNVNDVALARIDMIAEGVLKCIKNFQYPVSASVTLCLTGGGVSYIKGIRDYLGKYLGYDVNIVSPAPYALSYPDLAGEVSLLDMAINTESR